MPKVLIIDDDPQLRSLLTKILSAKDYEVSSAKDGIEGLDSIKTSRPDLIMLDIIMPGMNGFEVAQRLREDPSSSDIPIMVLTAFATPAARDKAMDAGADAFVTKPFKYEEVLTQARAMIASTGSAVAQTAPLNGPRQARLIAVHSLSGGLGCTALTINLAFALKELWRLPTLLLDGDFSGGQVGISLKWGKGMSWSDVLRAVSRNAFDQALEDPTLSYDTGLHILAAPRDPTDVDLFTPQVVNHAIEQLTGRYEYIVADLAHDFRESTVELLNNAGKILYLLGSDSASLHLARKALKAYTALGIEPGAVELIMVDTRPGEPAAVSEIESLAGRPLLAYIPYAAELNATIERGQPLVKALPNHPISTLAEDLAFVLSKKSHRDTAGSAPTPANIKPRPQLSTAGQNGTHHGTGHSLLKRMGLLR